MKYKKLDNLDDLRVGDVLEGIEHKPLTVCMIVQTMMFLTDDVGFVYTYHIPTLQKINGRAKRPLPEKKVKRWRPGVGERYFVPDVTAKRPDLWGSVKWRGDSEDKLWRKSEKNNSIIKHGIYNLQKMWKTTSRRKWGLSSRMSDHAPSSAKKWWW